MKQEIIIVGGGASGLMAAITAARNGKSVLIIEHKDKMGKKILATGNGKCNYTNRYQDASCYRCNQEDFPMEVMEQFDVTRTTSFFEELGIYPKDKNGYLYPYSEQATSILDVLQMEVRRLGVSVVLDEHVTTIEKQGKGFVVKTDQGMHQCNKVILCTGSKAGSNLGADGSGYDLAKKFGHKIVTVVPALTALRSKEKYFKGIAGVRVEANCTLFINGQYTFQNQGELQLTNYGLSGIPIFQISRYAAKGLAEKKEVMVQVDYMPNQSYQELFELIERRIANGPDKTMEELFVGLFNQKLTAMFLAKAGCRLEEQAKKSNTGVLHKLVKVIKCLEVPVYEANPFEQAQVCAGGVDTKQVDPNTLESKLVKGVYFAGELLDVDGICGGYNLQWAWSSGQVAGNAASK